MSIAYIITAIVLSAVLVVTGRFKLIKEKEVTETLTRLNVPLNWFPILASLQFAGAAGLLIGIFFRPLGIAAAVGVVLFFVGAVIAHLRAKDVKGTPMPAALAVFSAVPLALGLATV